MTPNIATQQGRWTLEQTSHNALAEPIVSNGVNTVAGFTYDARVVTTKGLQAVQNLNVGDRLITRGNGIVPIEALEQQSIIAPAVYFIAGSLGHYPSNRDSLLPAGQPVLVRDWRANILATKSEVLATAESLIDGEFVRNLGLQTMSLYRIFCKTSQILYADGMELASADPFQTATNTH
ncbi:MAG: Hint domain-containing protein [Roseobacter sp.]